MDTDPEAEIHEGMDKPDLGELKSKPSFKVDLLRGNTTVSLLCSFVNPGEQEEGYSKLIIASKVVLVYWSWKLFLDDIFGIDEISIYEGDWNENVYAVSGEVVDSVS